MLKHIWSDRILKFKFCRKLIILGLCLAVLILTVNSCRFFPTANQARMKVEGFKESQLRQTPAPSLPIVEAEQVLQYALHNNFIQSQLAKVEAESGPVTWNFRSWLVEGDLWDVTIDSSGMWPSYSCHFVISQAGEFVGEGLSNSSCQYNK